MSVARVPHAEIFYRRVGDAGDPTVLVHGSWTDHRGWDGVVSRLGGGLELLAYDRRGHGRTVGEPRRCPVRDDAGDLAALLEATDFRPVHLVTHAYGGMVALGVAAESPELVRSITLHEPPCVGLLDDTPAERAEADRVLNAVRALESSAGTSDPARAVPGILRLFSKGDEEWERIPSDMRPVLLGSSTGRREEFDDPESILLDPRTLQGIEVPVLITVGARSAPFVHRLSDRLAAELPNPTLLRLPEVGHFPLLTHPDLFAGVIGSFLLDRNVPTS